MASAEKSRRIVMLAAGWICLATAGLNWWNMVGVGVTLWRIMLAGTITLIGVSLLIRGFRSGGAERS